MSERLAGKCTRLLGTTFSLQHAHRGRRRGGPVERKRQRPTMKKSAARNPPTVKKSAARNPPRDGICARDVESPKQRAAGCRRDLDQRFSIFFPDFRGSRNSHIIRRFLGG
eukprot:2785324-Prymnesium_polylepis.1